MMEGLSTNAIHTALHIFVLVKIIRYNLMLSCTTSPEANIRTLLYAKVIQNKKTDTQ